MESEEIRQSLTKKCSICGRVLPMGDFYKHGSKTTSACRECTRVREKNNRDIRAAAKLRRRKDAPAIPEPEPLRIEHIPHLPYDVVFEHYEGDNRCVKCALADEDINFCNRVGCTADERPDGPGYYRGTNSRKTDKRYD